MLACPRCGGAASAQGVCPRCGPIRQQVVAPQTSQPQVFRGSPAPPKDPGLILHEIVDDLPPPAPPGIILGEVVEAPPPIVQGLILTELPPEEPLMEGFEGTALDSGSAPRPRAEPEPEPAPVKGPRGALEAFPTSACPGCGTGLTDPPPAFCEACGHRLPRVRRAEAAVAGKVKGREGETKRCRPCGAKNSATRDRCVDCGAVL